ncbi:MAG: Serine protease [Candidatus Kaiserbacteria bacterium GW2011_GWA2_49_19]|uniref:Serine protease n=1 Tax=Candidatus Kaiserbacteria bacterium GW2011_GWA2_49_19 TaxID=1618669 RepID=A0A0G1YPE6_9BACT|nr:MAG: Serine protease [Candidatus Kaiserbacteria bacterium GW2011_GWA2_49_19]
MAGGIFADQIFWPYFINRPLFEKYNLEQPPVYVTERKEVVIQENTALQDAVEKVAKTVVGVRTKLVSGGVIEGSGLVATNDGLMVTLSSLAPPGENTGFFIEEEPQTFQILRRDSKTDLALVKLEANNLVTTGFADFTRLKLGQRVFLISYRLRSGRWQKGVNEGVIKTFNEDKIETSLVEKSGFLGSPLFDIEGNLVGLVAAGPDGQVEAVPVSKIKALLGF